MNLFLKLLDQGFEILDLFAQGRRLLAATGQLLEAQNNYERQQTLLEGGWTTRVRYDEARQTLETAQSRADAAQARLNIASNRLSFTELFALTALPSFSISTSDSKLLASLTKRVAGRA